MEFTPEEKDKLKKVMLFLVKRKHQESAGHCGFHPVELLELFDELVEEGQLIRRDTIHSNRYFLEKKQT